MRSSEWIGKEEGLTGGIEVEGADGEVKGRMEREGKPDNKSEKMRSGKHNNIQTMRAAAPEIVMTWQHEDPEKSVSGVLLIRYRRLLENFVTFILLLVNFAA